MDNILELSEDGKTIIGVNDEKITHITIPDGVITIGYRAFGGCSSLQSIDIPNSVTAIGKYAFKGCSALQSINISEDNPNYTSVNGVLFNKELTTIIKFPERKRIEIYNIPNSVTTIGREAFYGCEALQSINIPYKVKSIGLRAFHDCAALKSINVSRGNQHFTFIDGILFNKELNTIIKFLERNNIEKYTIPDSVTTIVNSAFSGCKALQSINIPNSVIKIRDEAFVNCSALQNINIPNRIKDIPVEAFMGCSSLQSIVIPNSVKRIGNSTFKDCSSLQNIVIPNSVMRIGNSAFEGCSSLQSIDISNSVTTIEENTFWDCSSLQSIDIPNSVTTIRNCAFEGCSSLQSIHIHWKQLDNIKVDYATFGIYDNSVNFEECTLYVPPGTRWEHRHHPIFSKFKNIEIEKQK